MHDDWPSPAFRAWMEEHMPKDEPKPMTRERLAEIKKSAEHMRGCMDLTQWMLQTKAKDTLHGDQMEMIEELLAEIDRLRSLQDDDTALLDWASTNFADHATTIRIAVEEDGWELRDALRGARDGTLANDLYGDDDDE